MRCHLTLPCEAERNGPPNGLEVRDRPRWRARLPSLYASLAGEASVYIGQQAGRSEIPEARRRGPHRVVRRRGYNSLRPSVHRSKIPRPDMLANQVQSREP